MIVTGSGSVQAICETMGIGDLILIGPTCAGCSPALICSDARDLRAGRPKEIEAGLQGVGSLSKTAISQVMPTKSMPYVQFEPHCRFWVQRMAS